MRALKAIFPKSSWWFLLIAFIPAFSFYAQSSIFHPRGIAIISLTVVSIGALAYFTPEDYVEFWEKAPRAARGIIAGVLAYTAIVTLGNASELYSLRLWSNFLFLKAPLTFLYAFAIVGAGLIGTIYAGQKKESLPGDAEKVLRGPKLITHEDAKTEAASLLKPGEKTVFWGALDVTESSSWDHSCIIGETGSGKTKSLQLYLQSILPTITPGSNRRALIYDAKQDLYSVIAGMKNVPCPVKTLNPLDARGLGWNIAEDVTSVASAIAVADVLIPQEAEANNFFPKAARVLLSAIMESFYRTPPPEGPRWTLRDVILTMRYTERLRTVLKNSKDTRYLLQKYANQRTANDISSTIENTMRLLSPVAAAWEHTEEENRIGLNGFMEKEFILLLGSHAEYEVIMRTINGIIVRRLFQLMLAKGESSNGESSKDEVPRHTWVVIDELRNTGPLPGLVQVLSEGRSKGIHVVLGFQDISGLFLAHGEKESRSILSGCKNQAFLRTGDPETQNYASSCFGPQDVELTKVNMSHGYSEQTGANVKDFQYSLNKQIPTKPVILPSQFKDDLPNPTRKTGISGYYSTACIHRPYFANLPGEFIEQALSKPDKDTPNLAPRLPKEMDLAEWTKDDLRRLNLEKYPSLLDPDGSEEAPEDLLSLLPERP